MVCFAAGLVRSVGSLFGLGLAAAATHSFAKSALNGALVAHGTYGGGDTSETRSRQAAALVFMTTGDLFAFGTSMGLESMHASPGLVFSLYWSSHKRGGREGYFSLIFYPLPLCGVCRSSVPSVYSKLQTQKKKWIPAPALAPKFLITL